MVGRITTQFLIKVKFQISEEPCQSESGFKLDTIRFKAFLCEQLCLIPFLGGTVHHTGILLNTTSAEEEILAVKIQKKN